MIKKRKLVFDKTTYTIEIQGYNGDSFNWAQTFYIYIDKVFSGYALVAKNKGLSGPTTYTLYKAGNVVRKIGMDNMYLPFNIVLDTIKAVDNDINK